MKTLVKSNQISILEIAKYAIYSFRVFLIGIAVHVLFVIGSSGDNQKKTAVPEVKQIIPTALISAKPAVDMYQIGI